MTRVLLTNDGRVSELLGRSDLDVVVDVRQEDGAPPALQVAIPTDKTGCRLARRLVESVLAAWGCTAIVDEVTLATGELVANALLHARPPVGLRLQLTPHGVRVEVSDGSPIRPRMRVSATVDTHGRGMALVDSVARAWGTSAHGPGKTVWCDVWAG